MIRVEPVRRRAPAVWKLGVLSLLYFVQGLPFGFQSKGLKLALTSLGLSMTAVTLSGLLGIPWSFKPLWGPFVDRHGSAQFGRRKSWIVPLQIFLALSFVAAAFMPPDENLRALMIAVFFMNLFASTQDVPVDGLAVDLLSDNELGAGNAVQVVGYKVGMIVGGSVLVAQLPRFGWRGLFFSMAAICVVATVVLLFVKEPPPSHPDAHGAKLTWREVWQRAKAMFTTPGAWWLIAFIGFYKAGESVATAVFEPFLQRVGGYPIDQVAAFGGWGMIGSLAGSVVGGVLATRVTLFRAVGWAAGVRAIPVLAMWALVAGLISMTPTNIIAITTLEHFFGGMLTTTMFAFMMSKVDKRIGATQFTLFASIEVLGKEPWGLASGALADTFGWSVTFALAVALSVAYLGLLLPMSRLEGGHAPTGGAPRPG